MHRFVRVLVAVAIAAPLVASMPGPAFACDCAGLDPHRIVRQADAIVAAHVIDAFPIDPLHTRSTLAVDGVYKGQVASSVTVISNVGASGGLDCAVLYPVGSTVDPLVLRQADQTYVVDGCSLAALPQIVHILGEPRPPPPGPPPTSPAPPVAAVVPPGAGVSWPAVGGGLLIAFALIVLAVRRLARESTAELASAEAGDTSADAAGGTEPPTESSD